VKRLVCAIGGVHPAITAARNKWRIRRGFDESGPPPATRKRLFRESALEATQGPMDGFFSQHPYKCYLEEVASVGD